MATDPLDRKLSKHFAERVHKIKDSAKETIKANEDLSLLVQEGRIEPPFWRQFGALRLTSGGIYVYGNSEHERYTTGHASYTYTSSPLSDLRLKMDIDGIRKISSEELRRYCLGDRETPVQLLPNGRLVVPKYHWPGEWFTNFVASYTPTERSELERYYKPETVLSGFPGSDRWDKLDKSQKEQAIEKMIERVEKSFLGEMPEKHFRIRIY